MNYYKIFQKQELSTIDWSLFRQMVIWKLDQSEFCLEFKNEPEDKTDVLNQYEARQYTRQEGWVAYEPIN
jgi:hypothetical protein